MKPESRFIARLHKRLPSEVYAEHTHNPYRRGIPDVYYEAVGGCLWAEYKYLPRASKVIHPLKLLSAHQQQWLLRAIRNNRRCAVIIGSPGGVIVLPGLSWNCADITPHWSPIQEAIGFITQQVIHETPRTQSERAD